LDTHPHRDMKMVSYVVDGRLTHADSMGNQHTLCCSWSRAMTVRRRSSSTRTRASALELDAGREIGYAVRPGRQAYLVQIEGASSVNGADLRDRDALESVGEDLVIRPQRRRTCWSLKWRR